MANNIIFRQSMRSDILTATVVLFILYVVANHVFRRLHIYFESKRRGCKSLPVEPTYLPFGLDMLQKILRAVHEERAPDLAIERFNSMARYTWRSNMLGTEYFVTAEPKNIQAMLATQFDDFVMGRARSTTLKVFFGKNLFGLSGQAAAHARETIRPQFTRDQITDLDLEERHFQNMLQCMPVLEKTGLTKEISLVVLFFRLTIDTATEFFFGQSTNSQLRKLHNEQLGIVGQEHDFHWAFDRSQELFGRILRFRKLGWFINGSEARECVNIMNNFTDGAIEQALRERNEKGWTDDKFDIITRLADQTKDRVAVRDHMIGLLIAGRDTTASTLSWLFYCLIRNPEAFKKLREAIIDKFGPYSDEPKDITFLSLKSCHYLQYCMNETLRLHPTLPFNSRMAARDTTLPVGGGPNGDAPVFVPKGTDVNFVPHVLQRRKDLWGADADEFRPERWRSRIPAWQYVPFGGGPRFCLGQQFGLTEVGYITVRMLQKFDGIEGLDVDLSRDWHYIRLGSSPGPGPNGYKVRLHEAGDATETRVT